MVVGYLEGYTLDAFTNIPCTSQLRLHRLLIADCRLLTANWLLAPDLWLPCPEGISRAEPLAS